MYLVDLNWTEYNPVTKLSIAVAYSTVAADFFEQLRFITIFCTTTPPPPKPSTNRWLVPLTHVRGNCATLHVSTCWRMLAGWLVWIRGWSIGVSKKIYIEKWLYCQRRPHETATQHSLDQLNNRHHQQPTEWTRAPAQSPVQLLASRVVVVGRSIPMIVAFDDCFIFIGVIIMSVRTTNIIWIQKKELSGWRSSTTPRVLTHSAFSS